MEGHEDCKNRRKTGEGKTTSSRKGGKRKDQWGRARGKMVER